MNNTSDDEALDPAAMLDLVDRQQRSVGVQRGGFAVVMMGSWGITWLVGFIALWLIDGLRPAFGLPIAVGVWIFVLLLIVAIGVSVAPAGCAPRAPRGSPAPCTA